MRLATSSHSSSAATPSHVRAVLSGFQLTVYAVRRVMESKSAASRPSMRSMPRLDFRVSRM